MSNEQPDPLDVRQQDRIAKRLKSEAENYFAALDYAFDKYGSVVNQEKPELPPARVLWISRKLSLWISLREFIADIRRRRKLPESVILSGNAWERL